MARQQAQALPGGGTGEGSLETALEWFALLQDGSATEAERAAFEAWYGASPENGKAYAQVAELWGAPEFSAALSQAATPNAAGRQSTSHMATARHPSRPGRRVAYLVAMAAVLLLGVFLGFDRFGLFGPQADYRTGVGEIRKVALADGSVLTLNTDSAVRVDIRAGERRIELLEGEGFFEVVRDEERPFVVATGGTTVRVLGTSFAVYRNDDRTAVAVKSGRVSVQPATTAGGGLVLTPGQRAVVASAGTPRVSTDDGAGVFAWLTGRIVFQNAPLAEVLADLDRYYGGWIYTVGDIDAVRVSGNFRLDEPAAVVHALARSAGATVTRLPGDILILR